MRPVYPNYGPDEVTRHTNEAMRRTLEAIGDVLGEPARCTQGGKAFADESGQSHAKWGVFDMSRLQAEDDVVKRIRTQVPGEVWACRRRTSQGFSAPHNHVLIGAEYATMSEFSQWQLRELRAGRSGLSGRGRDPDRALGVPPRGTATTLLHQARGVVNREPVWRSGFRIGTLDSDSVRALQTRMRQAYPHELVVDGDFLAQTEKAVRYYARVRRLPAFEADGLVGLKLSKYLFPAVSRRWRRAGARWDR